MIGGLTLSEIQDIRECMDKIKVMAKGKDPIKFVEDLIAQRAELLEKIAKFKEKEEK